MLRITVWYLGWGLACVCSVGYEVFQITEWLVCGWCYVGGGCVVKYRCEDGRQKS